MRLLFLALAVLHAASPSRAATLESLSAAGFDAQMPKIKFTPAKKKIPFWWDAKPKPLPGLKGPGVLVARMGLDAQLDRHHYLLRLQLGSGAWDVGVAGDPALKSYYLTFKQGAKTRVAPLGELGRLRSGVDIEIEPGLVYGFKLTLAIFDPLRRSTLKIAPARGTRGPVHNLKVGDVIDAVRRQAFHFSADGHDYWGFYGTDVDPNTGWFTASRSLLFVRYDGLGTRAWPLAESAVPLGQPTQVELATPLLLTRDANTLGFSKP